MQSLKDLRNNKGVSQSEVARYLGISRQAYGFYETGAREASYETLLKLGEYFECSLDYLLRGDNAPHAPPDAKKAAEGEITFDDFDFALYGEVRELDDEEKEELLNSAKRMNKLRLYRAESVFQRDNYTCCICGKTKNDGVELVIDHIIPRSRGGKTTEGNLQTLCSKCNILKGATNP